MDAVRTIEFATYGVTVIHPLALIGTVAAGLSLFFIDRKYALLPVLMVICLIPSMQRIVIATLDFNMIRILTLFALTSMIVKKQKLVELTAVDKALIYWCLLSSITYVIREASFGAVVFRVGWCFEFLGMYFWFRNQITTRRDAENAVANLAVITIIVAIGIAMEWSTRYNVFSIFGGVDAITDIRDGRLRCQGAFSHPILTGAFGATLFPLMIGLFVATKHRGLAILALVGSLIIVVGSASSGPLFAFVAGVAGWCLWPMRRSMKAFRWGLSSILIFIHLVREPPVWHLIGRAGDLVGGTGYHRVRLISAFVDNFTQWVFVGSGSMGSWGWGLQDITNQYINEGVNGGIIALVAFVAILVFCYKHIGARTSNPSLGRLDHLWWWGIGACICSHTVSFIGVSYFGQMWVVVALHVALLSNYNKPNETSEERHVPLQGPAPPKVRYLN